MLIAILGKTSKRRFPSRLCEALAESGLDKHRPPRRNFLKKQREHHVVETN